ncbi:orotidine-5'-phosphate decarboxylase [Radiobacillus sp. PE A8.2]|uniref:orotidine-5'-phosphate decarboxylase n=1 Tax=Radiobacillus sp. PE A8.2 TaxID=3380349 RepID=UPI00388E106D
MKQPIYLALDFPTWKEAAEFLEAHDLHGVPVKVGMELFYKEGPKVIEQLKMQNHPIFLDLKLHDIPTTVRRAMRNIAKLGVDIINVHALGGSDMISAAKQGLMEGALPGESTKLIAVTVLTSMDETILQQQLNIQATVDQTVKQLAYLSKQSGADGVVCSVHEVPMIKEVCGDDFLTVTPGIRLDDSATNDQKRIATPKLARQKGTDAIVIGRSVTQSPDPHQAYNQVIEEWTYVSKA